MKTPIIEGFDKIGLESYLNARIYDPMYWASFFPLKNVNTLDGKTVIGDVGSRIAAYVISYDASSPEAGRKSIRTQHFDIPKIAISRRKTEKEILEHQVTRYLQGNNAVIEDYFNDIDFCFDSVMARMEWLALQAISQTKVTLSTANNAFGIVNETAIDFGMPAANKKTVAVVWSTGNAATMTPLADMVKVIKDARTVGRTFSNIIISRDAYDLIVASTEFINAVKQFVQGYTTVIGNIGEVVFKDIISKMGLPPITVIDANIGNTAADGSTTYANPFSSTHILFVPQLQLGSMFNAPIAEELEKPIDVLQSKKANVLISIKKDSNPISILTKGECNVFPSWNNIDFCYNMYTGHTSVWA